MSQPTPPMSATLNRATNTNDAGSPQTSGAYHSDSRSSTHLQSPRINASQPTRSKPYSTNHREQEDPTWPFALSRAVFNSGVMRAKNNLRKKTPCGIQITKRCLPQHVACTNRLTNIFCNFVYRMESSFVNLLSFSHIIYFSVVNGP